MQFSKNYPPLEFYKNLIPFQHQSLFLRYISFLWLLAKRADKTSSKMSERYLNLQRAVSKKWSNKTLLGGLQQDFIAENLSLSLLIEPIEGFQRLNINKYQLNFFEAVPILMQIVAPISRMIAVLNHQRPPFYQPFANLIFGYLFLYINENEDLKKYMQNNKITMLQKDTYVLIPYIHQETAQLMSATQGLIFRIKIGFYLGLFLKMTKKQTQNTKNIKKLDYVNAFLYGLWQSMTKLNKLTDLNQG